MLWLVLLGTALKPKRQTNVYLLGSLTDEELYRRFAAGDEEAFEALFERYGDRVFGYLARFFGDREVAKDLTQEAFTRVIVAARTFRGECSFATFIFRIVRNLCTDFLRSHSKSATLALDTSDENGRPLSERLSTREHDNVDKAFSEEIAKALERALEVLPEEQREVFLLRASQGLSFREIAEVLGVNENTAKSRMHYAVRALRQHLSGFQGCI